MASEAELSGVKALSSILYVARGLLCWAFGSPQCPME